MTKNSIKKMLPMFLAIAGSSGVIATAVTAVHATPKALCKKRSHAPACTVFRSHRAGGVTHFIKSA